MGQPGLAGAQLAQVRGAIRQQLYVGDNQSQTNGARLTVYADPHAARHTKLCTLQGSLLEEEY